jgi:hypothetical protein
MAHTLNATQHEVLRWIADGCPHGVMEGYAHRVSARALKTRGLVHISGKGPTWRAELTDRGRLQLEASSADTSPKRPSRSGVGATVGVRSASDDHRDRSSPVLGKTERLVADVIAAGGRLTRPDERGGPGGVDWRQRAYAAQRFGRVPDGKHLSVAYRDGQVEITLRDGATGNELGADEVPVPARLSRPHATARQYRDTTGLHEVSRKALPRAVRIVHALAVEAQRRGYSIACEHALQGPAREGSRGRSAHLEATVAGHSFSLRLFEQGVGQRGPWEERRRRRAADRDSLRYVSFDSQPIEPYDKGATGQLELEILSYGPRQLRWGDRKRWRLEDRLPQALRELETLAEEREQQRRAREREEAERRACWERAIADARTQAVEHHRAEDLRRRMADWREADEIRAYCDAVQRRVEARAFGEHGGAEVERFLDYARGRADRLQELPVMPAPPELRDEDLRAFLPPGVRPYGPTSRGW